MLAGCCCCRVVLLLYYSGGSKPLVREETLGLWLGPPAPDSEVAPRDIKHLPVAYCTQRNCAVCSALTTYTPPPRCRGAAASATSSPKPTSGGGSGTTSKMSRSYGDSESEMESDHLLEAGKQRSSSMSAKAQLRVQAVVVCTLYAIVGPSLVLVNNHILKSLNFPFPLFLSALGLITTSCVCFFIIRVLPQLKNEGRHPPPTRAAPLVDDVIAPSADGRRLSGDGSSQIQPSHLPNGGVSLQFWLRNMVPIGAAQGLTFASTNAAYMYLTITFTQVRDDALECAAREAARETSALPSDCSAPSPLACHPVRERAVTHTIPRMTSRPL